MLLWVACNLHRRSAMKARHLTASGQLLAAACIVAALSRAGTAQSSPTMAPVVVAYLAPDSASARQVAYDRGARMAVSEAARAGQLLRRDIRLIDVPRSLSADSTAALLSAAGARVLVAPGLTEATASQLARWAAHRGTAILAPAAEGHRTCDLSVFRTGPDLALRAAALARGLSSQAGIRRWHVLADSSAESRAALREVRAATGSSGVRIVDAVGSDNPVPALPALAAATLEEQTGFLIIRAADGVAHTIDSLARGAAVIADARSSPSGVPGRAWHSIALWHHDLHRFGARQLTDRYLAEYDTAMTSDAWEGWMAMKAAWESGLRARDGDVAAALSRGGFDGHKGAALRFDPGDRTLRQPLVIVRHDGTGTSPAVVQEVPWPSARDSTHHAPRACGAPS